MDFTSVKLKVYRVNQAVSYNLMDLRLDGLDRLNYNTCVSDKKVRNQGKFCHLLDIG